MNTRDPQLDCIALPCPEDSALIAWNRNLGFRVCVPKTGRREEALEKLAESADCSDRPETERRDTTRDEEETRDEQLKTKFCEE